ncbi:MAG: DDE transposase family protein [Bacteroidaceae bacterium]|nr:DDE transposase family protein [Bacteroidaceae bacterium]
MAELTSQQKKEYAKMLFLKENLTQLEIAERVSVSRQTVARWMKEGKWEEHKVGITTTREAQIANFYRQIAEINRVISEREEGQRFATPAEADTLGKLAAAVKKMEADVGIADIISVGMRFIGWIRPVDIEKSKEFIRLWDAFIKDCL